MGIFIFTTYTTATALTFTVLTHGLWCFLGLLEMNRRGTEQKQDRKEKRSNCISREQKSTYIQKLMTHKLQLIYLKTPIEALYFIVMFVIIIGGFYLMKHSAHTDSPNRQSNQLSVILNKRWQRAEQGPPHATEHQCNEVMTSWRADMFIFYSSVNWSSCQS